MAPKAKHLLEELSHQGPHPVLRGDLALVGLPGVVFTPASGLGRPAVAFGHGWLQPPARYTGLLRHLASWGIVAAAPATHAGPLASHRLFAADLRTALDVCVGVRLGGGEGGELTVDPERLGLAGHGIGGGCAILAAADAPGIRAVATLAPAQTKPFATDAAARCAMPGFHLGAGRDQVAPPAGNADPIARAWDGEVISRTLPKATHLGFTEGRHWSNLLIPGKAESGTQRVAKALLTAFFLVHVAGEHGYEPLLAGELKAAPLGYHHEARSPAPQQR